MSLLCVAATAREMAAVFPSLRESELVEHAPLALHDGLMVCVSGVGPLNAALALGRMLALHAGIGAVLTVGLAGSFDLARAPLACAMLVTEEIFPEYGLAGDEGVHAAGLGFAQWQGPDGPVLDRLPLCAHLPAFGLPALPQLVPGSSLTVAGVTASSGRAARLAERYGALSENMEGFAVALACARAGVPCAEIRAISNKVGSRAGQDRAFPAALAQLGAIGQSLFGA